MEDLGHGTAEESGRRRRRREGRRKLAECLFLIWRTVCWNAEGTDVKM